MTPHVDAVRGRWERREKVPQPRSAKWPHRSGGLRWPCGLGTKARHLALASCLAAAALAPSPTIGPVGGVVIAATDPVIRDDVYKVLEDHDLVVPAPGVLANDTPGSNGLLGNLLCVVSWYEGKVLHEGAEIGVAYVDKWSTDGGATITFTPNTYGQGEVHYNAAQYSPRDACPGPASPTWQGSVEIAIIGVNDPPLIQSNVPPEEPLAVNEDGGTSVHENVVRIVSWGPYESDYVKEWIVSTPDPEQFSEGPLVYSTGHYANSLQFTPAANASGWTSIRIRIRDSGGTANDGQDRSNVLEVPLLIVAVPDAPTAAADRYAARAGSPLRVAAPGVLGNDVDVDGDPLTAVLGSFPGHGDLSLTPDGSFTYRPDAGFAGTDSFAYRASDGDLLSPLTSVRISVTSTSPTATPAPVTTSAPLASTSTEPAATAVASAAPPDPGPSAVAVPSDEPAGPSPTPANPLTAVGTLPGPNTPSSVAAPSASAVGDDGALLAWATAIGGFLVVLVGLVALVKLRARGAAPR